MKGQVKGIWALCGSAESLFWSLALLVSKLKEAALCLQGCLWRIFSSEEHPAFLLLQQLARKSQSICDCWELLDCSAISNTTTLPLNNFSRNDAIISSCLALPKGNTPAIAPALGMTPNDAPGGGQAVNQQEKQKNAWAFDTFCVFPVHWPISLTFCFCLGEKPIPPPLWSSSSVFNWQGLHPSQERKFTPFEANVIRFLCDLWKGSVSPASLIDQGGCAEWRSVRQERGSQGRGSKQQQKVSFTAFHSGWRLSSGSRLAGGCRFGQQAWLCHLHLLLHRELWVHA